MNSRVSHYFFFILLLGAVAAAAFIFWPFITPVVLAIATTVLVFPVYTWFSEKFGQGIWAKRMAAFVTTILVLIVIVVPLIFLFASIYSEIQILYSMLIDEGNRSSMIASLNSVSQVLSDMVFGVVRPYSFDALNVTEYIKSILQWGFANLESVIKSVALIAGYIVIFLLSLFYFLRDGEALMKRFMFWSPLLETNHTFITRTLKRAIQSVFVGALLVSLLDGISIGIAFKIFGIPAPALWGTIAAIAALVPGLGTSIVILPAAAYLFISGQYLFAVGLLIWGYLGVLVIDHILGPNLVNKGIRLHPLLVLLSVLGGMLVFGVIGFVMGPIVLATMFALLDIYRMSLKK